MFRFHVFFPIFLLFFSYIFGVSFDILGSAQLILRCSVLLFCLFSFIIYNCRYKKSSIIIILFLWLLFFLLFVFNSNLLIFNYIYLSIILFYLSSFEVSHKELLLYCMVSTFLVLMIYSFAVLFLDVKLSDPVNIGGRVRHYLGFSNPNQVGIVSYSLIIITYCSFREKLTNYYCLFSVVLVSFFLIYISDSRTALFSSIIFFLFLSSNSWMYLRRFIFIVPIFLLFLSFYVASFSSNDFVNTLLSFRPVDYQRLLDSVDGYGYLFGTNFHELRIDNSYLLAYFSAGPFVFVFLVCFMLLDSFKSLNKFKLSFFMSLFAYGFMEGVLVRVEFPVVLYFYYLLFYPDRTSQRQVRSLQPERLCCLN